MVKQGVRERLKVFMDMYGVSSRAVERATNFSKSAINLYLHGKYPGHTRNIEGAIERFLEEEEARRKQGIKKVGYVQTELADRVHRALKVGLIDYEIILIIGRTGLGKSWAVSRFAERHKSAVLIQAHAGFEPRFLMVKILEALEMNPKGRLSTLTDRVIEALKDSGKILVIDEADLLSERSLNLLRRIYDLTQAKKDGGYYATMGLALVGTERLYEKLYNGRELNQLLDRAGYSLNLGLMMKKEDMERILEQEPGMTLEAQQLLAERAQGKARRLTRLVHKCRRVMTAQAKERIDGEVVREADRMLAGV